MQFSSYQKDARRTDQMATRGTAEFDRTLVPLLGLVGEAGQLLSEFKNFLVRRDDRSHLSSLINEELGDILWYVSNIADQFGLNLDDVAFANLIKVQNRWPTAGETGSLNARVFFDATYPEEEQLPRQVTLGFEDASVGGRNVVRITFVADGSTAGDKLTDNAFIDDGYRFHDAFHLAYAAILGWSPVLRSLWKRKRKSNPRVDEVEDGGRAVVIEEGIAALVFSDAKERHLYDGADRVDSSILRVVRNMSSHLEVSIRSYREWQDAILQGYSVFRALQSNGGGFVHADLINRRVEYKRTL